MNKPMRKLIITLILLVCSNLVTSQEKTYTVDDFSYRNIGLGASIDFGSVNMYLMGNNLLELQNVSKAQSVSLQIGINLIFDSDE